MAQVAHPHNLKANASGHHHQPMSFVLMEFQQDLNSDRLTF
jgi:hypothetical protein